MAREALSGDVQLGDESRRLAVMHLEWDRIRAVDLCVVSRHFFFVFKNCKLNRFVLFNSFVPTGGSIKRVLIVPSDFGVQRMAEVCSQTQTSVVNP